jgi:hypothetical protein
MPRSLKPKPSLYNPYEIRTEENNNRNFEIPFIFQDYRDSSTSTISSMRDSLEESFDTLIKRLTTNPPYKLTLTIEELLAPSKKKSKSNNRSYPPRPQNVFILFKKDLTAKLRRESPNFSLPIVEISKVAKTTWANLSKEVRQYFQFLYLACIEKHKELYPGYRYTPKKKSKSRPESKNRSKKVPVTVFPKLDYNNIFNELFNEESLMSEYFDFSLWDIHQQQR